MATRSISPLNVDQVYSWEELADVFGFQPAYFSVAGGMVPSKATGSLLLITHPGGGRSFDYGDYWDGEHLIYTGKGRSAISSAAARTSTSPRTASRCSHSRLRDRLGCASWGALETSRNGSHAPRATTARCVTSFGSGS